MNGTSLGFTAASTGWGLRVRYKERVILYMTPQQNQFLVSIVLGEKAVAAAATLMRIKFQNERSCS